GQVVGVFDWEMSALGDPLVDLGILLCYWTHAAAAGLKSSTKDSLATVTDRAGWFTREEIVEHYAAASGRDLSGLAFYEVFAVFKLAVVAQQIFYRYRRGQTGDPRFASLGERVAQLARVAATLAARA
ncbi:MAG: phosphotransferase, partial [Pyrinomonadaceae bacterium]